MAALGRSSTAMDAVQGHDLSGKVICVTGGNGGLGFESCKALASAGAHVIMCSRSVEAGETAAQEILATGVKGKITMKQLDLADLASIKALGAALDAELPRLDILLCNAGIMACPLSQTKQGFEMQIGVNHIGHAYLTQLLLPKLKSSGSTAVPARVVMVSSLAHVFGAIDLEDLNYEHRKYSAWGSYGQSKLANILFAKQLAVEMEAEGAPVLTYSLHPGSIMTNLQRHLGFLDWMTRVLRPVLRLLTKSIEQGAATSVVACTADGLPSGAYLVDCKVAAPRKQGEDMEMAKALWDKTESLLTEGLTKL